MEARREKRQGKEKIRGSTNPPVEGGESETVEKEAQEKRIFPLKRGRAEFLTVTQETGFRRLPAKDILSAAGRQSPKKPLRNIRWKP